MPGSVASEETSDKLEEIGIDTLALKELAKRSLVDALNSVQSSAWVVFHKLTNILPLSR